MSPSMDLNDWRSRENGEDVVQRAEGLNGKRNSRINLMNIQTSTGCMHFDQSVSFLTTSFQVSRA